MRIASLVLAAAPLVSAGHLKGSFKDAPNDVLPTLPGAVIGYVGSPMNGLSESSCYSSYQSSSYPCGLESFQQMPAPTALIAYGDKVIHETYYSSYYPMTFTSLDRTLQNVTSRSYSLKDDCKVPLYSPSSSYGAFQMPPRPVFAKDPVSGNGTLSPETKDLQFQILAFNSSDNYSLPNQTYFRLYDLDMSHPTECRAKEMQPSVEEQRKLEFGTGTIQCAVRKDEIDNNETGVVKSTHHAILFHDLSGSVCRGTDTRGYSQSCARVISLTSYSNGTKGKITVRDIANYPYTVTALSNSYGPSCFYDEKTDAVAIVGTTSSYAPAIVRLDGMSYSYSAPTPTLVRTLDSQIRPQAGTIMNLDGNIGFVDRGNMLVYSMNGDKLLNKSISVLASSSSSYNTMSYAVYAPNRTTSPY